MDRYHVYILAGHTRRLYVGVTNDLVRRIAEHKSAEAPGFARKYHIDQLVYFESFPRAKDAVEREKQIKSYRREKKIALIEACNPGWEDLGIPS